MSAPDPLRTFTCLCFALRVKDVRELSTMEAAEQLAAFSAQTKTKLEQWKAERWDEDEASYGAFRAIGVAIASKRAPPSIPEMKGLFAFAERLLKHGSGDMSNMVATCTLEAIWAAAHESGFDFKTVDPHLGHEARRYLLAWDQFNKTSTAGLTRG
jgi:hypothetical protein